MIGAQLEFLLIICNRYPNMSQVLFGQNLLIYQSTDL